MLTTSEPSFSVDVLVVGGGPVGILIAFQLARAGCSVHIIDKDKKSSTKESGRANAIYSRSAEFLDQLGLVDELLQQCHIVRESYTYDSNGKRVIPGRVWNFVENIDNSVYVPWFLIPAHCLSGFPSTPNNLAAMTLASCFDNNS